MFLIEFRIDIYGSLWKKKFFAFQTKINFIYRVAINVCNTLKSQNKSFFPLSVFYFKILINLSTRDE
jgi:hypothetical protein